MLRHYQKCLPCLDFHLPGPFTFIYIKSSPYFSNALVLAVILLIARLFIPLRTVLVSVISLVHAYVDLRVTKETVLKFMKQNVS